MSETDSPPMNPLPCFVCGRPLKNCGGPKTNGFEINQPCGGLAFDTKGHYGSTLYDPMHGYHELEIAICDDCLKERWARTRQVLRVDTPAWEVLVPPGLTYEEAEEHEVRGHQDWLRRVNAEETPGES